MARSVWAETEFRNENGTIAIKKIFDGKVFDYPKSVETLKRLLEMGTEKNSIVLDFFSGSATTAHAVMQLNAEDGGQRKFIMIQLPELCDEKSEAFKAGYKNICEIGKERIRRAGKNISAEIDKGFRVLKIDSTNFNSVYFKPKDWSQEKLSACAENIKSDRTALDLFFGCLTDWGVELNKNLIEETFDGAKIYDYNDGDLIACFDEKISEKVVEYMAKKNPLRTVFRDKSFASDTEKINAGEIFKLYSPNTSLKVI